MKQKKWFRYSFLMAVMAMTAVWLSMGCNTSIPPVGMFVPTAIPTMAPDIVSNFENGSMTMNNNLCGADNGYWLNASYGGSNSVASPLINPIPAAIQTPGTGFNGLHFYGTITDPGGGAYPALQLQAVFSSNPSHPYLDASATGCNFSGIQFQMNILADDTTYHQRLFGVATDQTITGFPGSNCPSNCNDLFWNDHLGIYTGVFGPNVGAGWVTYSYTWAQLYQEGWGNPASPAGMAAHLNKLILLEWKWTGNNVAGTYTADFWLDNIQFLP